MARTLGEFQANIREWFGAKDARRGIDGTFMWFMEEVGELAAGLRTVSSAAATAEERHALALEFADVLAWLATLANIAGIDLDAAVDAKYARGCARCQTTPCVCEAVKP